MSPASSGALEVERYIGACLISSNQTRSKVNISSNKCGTQTREEFYRRDHYFSHGNHQHLQKCHSVDGWAGGMPLISFASYQRIKPPVQPRDFASIHEDRRFPLSSLAVHTQGAPLILSTRYNQRKIKNRSLAQSKTSSCISAGKSKELRDSLSFNSDESSTSSTNSETCLPRIIKPRKRRKKDRKPHLVHPLSGQHECCFSTDSASPEIESPSITPYVPAFRFEFYETPAEYNSVTSAQKSFHSPSPIINDVQEFATMKDINDNEMSLTCQCRYCDPCGQIWDVDRNCYSPQLTAPEQQLSASKVSDYELSLISSDLIDALSDLSLRQCDDGIIKSDCDELCISASPRDLEVSTEIVTSHNGHRDIEIKFFSSAPGKLDAGGDICDLGVPESNLF